MLPDLTMRAPALAARANAASSSAEQPVVPMTWTRPRFAGFPRQRDARRRRGEIEHGLGARRAPPRVRSVTVTAERLDAGRRRRCRCRWPGEPARSSAPATTRPGGRQHRPEIGQAHASAGAGNRHPESPCRSCPLQSCASLEVALFQDALRRQPYSKRRRFAAKRRACRSTARPRLLSGWWSCRVMHVEMGVHCSAALPGSFMSATMGAPPRPDRWRR